ncbi:MAG: hypothetical protein A2784_04565 [Candidatus Chisholmbacteria bacterium RIFCSPHIGHO2_01_FULL_48_12]|uniref:Membrane protein 6-pyruvoyl-tetrahydropterin synthase-related domain-containing protein n=1 Tax=Candidatus Chisholmbacteria bacterium RIFCSPHIGHO2_01_FULL_48_12 TaxID=1797589 RepID=A0A1G1VMU0_9BACT|nr:MAG: hypothetical protein A2784_04565 [Candidatus Chisholmbacteria bacterium RIFCSPHIGHO2_01_FULL_48_12]
MSKLKFRHWPLALVWLILLVFFSPILFGKLPFPGDALVGLYHPYRDFYADKYPSGIPYRNFLLTDPVLQQIPWKYFAVNELKQGRIPWWNPYTHSGMPFLANFQAGVFYPLNLIFMLLRFNTAWIIYIVLQPFLGALFLYLFLRHHRLGPLSAALAGLTWVLGGFMLVWLEWGNLGHTLIWLPLSLLIIDKYQQTKKLRFLFLNSLLLSLSFFAGHLQLAFYVVSANIAYAIYRKIHPLFAVGYVLFAAASAVQWWPTLQLIKLSTRDIDQTQVLTRPDWFLPWQNLAQFIAPDFFGNPATLNYTGVWNYAEFAGYIGLVPLLLALGAVSSKAGRKIWLAIIFIFLFTLPTLVAKLPFILKLPLLSTAQPSRLIALISFGLAILAGIGLDQWLKRKINLKFPVAFIGASLVILWLIAFNSTSIVSLRNLILPTINFIIFIIIIFLPLKAKAYLLLLVVAADLLRFAQKFTPFSPREYFYPQTQAISFLEDNLGDYRYMTTDRRLLPPNAGIMYGLATIEGYDPLYLKSYAEVVTEMEGGIPGTIASFNRIIRPTNLYSPILNRLGVKYILSLNQLNSPQFKLVFQEGQTLVYENLKVEAPL